MSRYHSRRESLYEAERAEFVTRATALHKMMMEASRNLATSRADYRALTNLNGSICEAIKGITGEDPKWMRSAVDDSTPLSSR
ncbi:hypothetical protein GGQ64_004889 [Rhizobium azooxidifex]|uniref:Uncharacterized protein n=1 Tax=Mycoplana azooxidifex TaxID=1636188 RepID=A0A7W6DAK2_9HYPH|nr:hypothetical protein [Mycoplana azooxidifex]